MRLQSSQSKMQLNINSFKVFPNSFRTELFRLIESTIALYLCVKRLSLTESDSLYLYESFNISWEKGVVKELRLQIVTIGKMLFFYYVSFISDCKSKFKDVNQNLPWILVDQLDITHDTIFQKCIYAKRYIQRTETCRYDKAS